MNTSTRETATYYTSEPLNNPLTASAVSWGAILAGAAAAAAMSLILLVLGTGLGLSLASPWGPRTMGPEALGITSIVWIVFTSLVASCTGGYLAGRLRTKWISIHTDEVYFRDTAHGFLAWAIATLATAALFTSLIGVILGKGIDAGTSVAQGIATGTAGAAVAEGTTDTGSDEGPVGYIIDSLFRRNTTATSGYQQDTSTASDRDSRDEVGQIISNLFRTGSLPEQDISYMSSVIAEETGITQEEAEARVNTAYANLREMEAAAKETADKVRRASAKTALWLFLSLLIGAFLASLSATYGGRQRDL